MPASFMEYFPPTTPFVWGLAALLVFSRALDFFSTWVVTPRLALEANPLMRRLGWGPMALLNLPLAGLAFLHPGLAVTFTVTSLLVAGSNLSAGALARGMGERRQLQRQAQAIRAIGLGRAWGLNTLGSCVAGAAGGWLMVLAESPRAASWWGGLGVGMFAMAGLVHGNAAIWRIWKQGAQLPHLPDGPRPTTPAAAESLSTSLPAGSGYAGRPPIADPRGKPPGRAGARATRGS